MCTIIVACGVWSDRPLVIAANRDEALDRPAEDPRLRRAGEVAARAVLAPRDLRSGGSWLGLNDRGLFVGITNRRPGPAGPDPTRRSRGELVFDALGCESRERAVATIAARSARDYNGFHLLIAEREGATVIWSDGAALHRVELDPGIHWLTERSFGAGESARHELLDRWSTELAAGPEPTPARWRELLANHQPGFSGFASPPATAVSLDALCVHAQPLNYGTRSSTLLRLGPGREATEFHHASGRPCEHAFVELRAEVDELLAQTSTRG